MAVGVGGMETRAWVASGSSKWDCTLPLPMFLPFYMGESLFRSVQWMRVFFMLFTLGVLGTSTWPSPSVEYLCASWALSASLPSLWC